MMDKMLFFIVCALYALPVIGVIGAIGVPLSLDSKWSALMILLPVVLLGLACIVMAHVVIFDLIRFGGRRQHNSH